MRLLCILILFTLCNHFSFAQDDRTKNQISEQENNQSVRDNAKNTFYGELGGKAVLYSINYDRLFPIGEKSAISAGIGFTFGEKLYLFPEINFLYGGPKHYFEIGLSYDYDVPLLIPRVGYRYHGIKGFFFRLAPIYLIQLKPDTFGNLPWAGLSLGYSF